MRGRASLGFLFVVAVSFGLAGCGSSDTGDSAAASTSSGAGASSSEASSTSGTGGTGMGGAGNGGSGGDSAGGGQAGGASAASVDLTLDPTTIPAGGTAAATVVVKNFTLVPPKNQLVDGEGHYHIYLDKASGGNYLVANQVPMVTIKIPAATTPGPHTVRVSLSDNHHVELEPPVEDIVDITVQ